MKENFAEYVWAYAAGLLDGEGTVGLQRRHKNQHRSPLVSIPSCTPRILSWLWTQFGGCISSKRTYKAEHSASGVWTLAGDEALAFFDRVLPYMQEPEKIRRVRLLITDYKSVTPRNGKYTAKALERRRSFERQFFKNTRRRLALAL